MNPFQSQSARAKGAAIMKRTYWAGIDWPKPKPAPIAAISAASASPIQRSGRTIGAVSGAKSGLSAIFPFSVSELGYEGARIHQQPNAECAADADGGIEQGRHAALVGLPDEQPQHRDDRQQQHHELRNAGREQRTE